MDVDACLIAWEQCTCQNEHNAEESHVPRPYVMCGILSTQQVRGFAFFSHDARVLVDGLLEEASCFMEELVEWWEATNVKAADARYAKGPRRSQAVRRFGACQQACCGNTMETNSAKRRRLLDASVRSSTLFNFLHSPF